MTATTNTSPTDIRVSDQGSIVLLTPISKEAKEWLDEHCHTEGYQWIGASLAVEHRYANDIIDGAIEDGLIITAG